MSAPTITSGRTWVDGETVTPARINLTLTGAALNFTQTDVLAGRSTSGAGAAEEIACTAAGRALLDDADAAAQRTTLGLGTAAVRPASGPIVVRLAGSTTATGTGANTTETDLISHTITGGTLATNGDVLRATVAFTTGANSNNKTFRVKWGSTTIATIGPYSGNNDIGVVTVRITRTGATAQLITATASVAGLTTARAYTATGAETLASSVTFKCTGQNGTASANDVLQIESLVEFIPAA